MAAHDYDTTVSTIENYTQHCLKLKQAAKNLAIMLTPSLINQNGRMGSDQAIADQAERVKVAVEAVEMLEGALGIKERS